MSYALILSHLKNNSLKNLEISKQTNYLCRIKNERTMRKFDFTIQTEEGTKVVSVSAINEQHATTLFFENHSEDVDNMIDMSEDEPGDFTHSNSDSF